MPKVINSHLKLAKMKESRSDVAEFYDDYTKREAKIHKNLRHYKIQNEINKRGLKSNYNILEVGCSNGALSELLCRLIPNGKFLGVDISPKSIEIAKSRFKKFKNADFQVSDMLDFSYPAKFDIIVFPDVLEHIPEDKHKVVFENISKVSHENTEIFINIPSPELNNYLRREEPEELQIIDQELNLGKLITVIENEAFTLDIFKRHSIFRKEKDYIIMWFRKKRITDLSKKRNVFFRVLEKYLYKFS